MAVSEKNYSTCQHFSLFLKFFLTNQRKHTHLENYEKGDSKHIFKEGLIKVLTFNSLHAG